MNERILARMLAPLARAVVNMLARGTVAAVDATRKMQSLQIKLLLGEAKNDVEHVEPYGYTSHPHAGAEHITLFLAGDRSHGVTVVVADRRYRLQGLAAGEVALYDDLGQTVHLTRSGIVIDGAGLPMTIHNTPHITADTPEFTMTGNLTVTGDVSAGGNVPAGAISLTKHVHSGIMPGGSNTGAPL